MSAPPAPDQAIRQTFTKTRYGWTVRTRKGIGLSERDTCFAFTRAGIERKAARLRRRLKPAPPESFELIDGRPPPPPASTRPLGLPPKP